MTIKLIEKHDNKKTSKPGDMKRLGTKYENVVTKGSLYNFCIAFLFMVGIKRQNGLRNTILLTLPVSIGISMIQTEQSSYHKYLFNVDLNY